MAQRRSNYAVAGLYLCGNYALDIAERPRPSPRQRDTGYGTHLKGRLTEFRQ